MKEYKHKYLSAIYLGSIILIFISHFNFPIILFFKRPYTLIGSLIILFSAAPILLAGRELRKNGITTKSFTDSEVLIASGIFRITRNPAYVSMVLFLAGESIFLGSLTPLIVTMIFGAVINYFFIPIEEKILSKRFGTEYFIYTKEVRRWI